MTYLCQNNSPVVVLNWATAVLKLSNYCQMVMLNVFVFVKLLLVFSLLLSGLLKWIDLKRFVKIIQFKYLLCWDQLSSDFLHLVNYKN